MKKKKDSKTDAAADTGPAIQENSSEKGRERDVREREGTHTHTHTTPRHTYNNLCTYEATRLIHHM